MASPWTPAQRAPAGGSRDQRSTACQLRFDDDGSLSGHLPPCGVKVLRHAGP